MRLLGAHSHYMVERGGGEVADARREACHAVVTIPQEADMRSNWRTVAI